MKITNRHEGTEKRILLENVFLVDQTCVFVYLGNEVSIIDDLIPGVTNPGPVHWPRCW